MIFSKISKYGFAFIKKILCITQGASHAPAMAADTVYDYLSILSSFSKHLKSNVDRVKIRQDRIRQKHKSIFTAKVSRQKVTVDTHVTVLKISELNLHGYRKKSEVEIIFAK